MPLLDAPQYDRRKEALKKNLFIGSLAAVALLILLTVGGYIAGHGWLFSNLPAEHRVDKFFAALKAKDYETAYALYNNDSDWKQHSNRYKDYPESRFQEDWSTQPPIGGPLNSYHVDISRTDGDGYFGTGIIVAVTVNDSPHKVFMYYIRKTGTLSWPAYHEIQY